MLLLKEHHRTHSPPQDFDCSLPTDSTPPDGSGYEPPLMGVACACPDMMRTFYLGEGIGFCARLHGEYVREIGMAVS